MSTLRVEGIVKRYGGAEVLRSVSMTAPAGRITAVIGPNGAGKSTLANVITGVVTPDAGRVFLDDRDITGLPAHRRARLGLARTFQNLQLFSGMTVDENLYLGAFRNPRRDRGRQRLLESAAARFGLDGLRDRPSDSLSFGQAKLVELARVMAMQPNALVIDEPAAGLSWDGVVRLEPWIVEQAHAGLAVVLIEHNMRLVMGIADYVYVLDYGALIAEGTPAEVRADQRVLEAYLGPHAGEAEVATR